jgi:putative selenium metabolism hydrolase
MDRESIGKKADELLPQLVSFLRDIIAIPSPSCREKDVLERVEQELRKTGFDRVEYDPVGNLYGVIGNGSRKILYNGHVDTVGVSSPGSWLWDPFSGKHENKVIYGRGAADMKGAVASFVYAGRLIRELDLTGDYTLAMSFVVQEEDCEGSAIGLAHGNGWIPGMKNPDCVLLGEPSNLRIIRGQRGKAEMKAVARGKAAHGSMPWAGENAIYRMLPLIREIELQDADLPSDPFLGRGSIAVTRIECRTASNNSIPDECTVYIDRRLTKGETGTGALSRLRSFAGEDDIRVDLIPYDQMSWRGFRVLKVKDFPSWVLPGDHPLVTGAARLFSELFGREGTVGRWDFSTDGVYTRGIAGLPTIGFGPGEERHCHTADEQVSEDHLRAAMMFYAALPSCLS